MEDAPTTFASRTCSFFSSRLSWQPWPVLPAMWSGTCPPTTRSCDACGKQKMAMPVTRALGFHCPAGQASQSHQHQEPA